MVLEPKSRQVNAEMLMESLFKLTDLENRFNMNLNVLDANGSPRVMSLAEALSAFLAHRREVLQRKSKHRLTQIDHRLEVLGGLLIAYLNLDEVIRIIREEDDPKKQMMQKWKLTEVQVEAILNMRLRSLRKLEEMEIRREHDSLAEEKSAIQEILANEALQWKVIADDIKLLKKQFAAKPISERRTQFAEAPKGLVIAIEAFVEKEPITIVCSKLGWIRTSKGHQIDADTIKYKEGDEQRFIIPAQTTDKLLLLSTSGRVYTIGCDKLPSLRGHGEPVRLMVEMEQQEDIADIFIYTQGSKRLMAATNGKGFVIQEDELIAQTRNGKQIINVSGKEKALKAIKISGDTVAVVGQNRKLLLFPVSEVPEMKRGQGVQLQKYKDGGMSDIKICMLAEGLSWQLGDRIRIENELTEWMGKRGSTGRMPPNGFPKSNKFES
jgi:topoisomerase IV subunit A